MADPQVKPFSFDELEQKDEPTPTTPLTEADIKNAYDQGYEEGRAEAMASTIKTQTDTLKAMQASLQQEIGNFRDAVLHERTCLKVITKAFITEYCQTLGIRHETQAAENLLMQLFQTSPEKDGTTLKISHESDEHLKAHLEALVHTRNAESYLSIEVSDELQHGECRLDWRTGSITQDFDIVRVAVEKIISAEPPATIETEQAL